MNRMRKVVVTLEVVTDVDSRHLRAVTWWRAALARGSRGCVPTWVDSVIEYQQQPLDLTTDVPPAGSAASEPPAGKKKTRRKP